MKLDPLYHGNRQTQVAMMNYLEEHPDCMPIFTIYEHPTDAPDYFVMRLFLARPGGELAVSRDAIFGLTLEDIRRWVPSDRVMLMRAEGDDPKIVETWI